MTENKERKGCGNLLTKIVARLSGGYTNEDLAGYFSQGDLDAEVALNQYFKDLTTGKTKSWFAVGQDEGGKIIVKFDEDYSPGSDDENESNTD